jgi:magnesium transporter
MNQAETDHLHQPVTTVARKDVATLHADSTVRQALDDIRSHGLGERIVYFYVVDDDGRLVGVIPTRRLLTSSLDQRLSEVMIRRVVTIPPTATVLEAHEVLARHKLLAIPIVDSRMHIVGVVDVGAFADEKIEVYERERMEELFESIGFRVSQVRDASALRAFRFRFPWLLTTIASGIICALLASAYNLTLAESLVLVFFLTLVLGLGESVSMQSMTVTIQSLRLMQPTWRWYVTTLWRETGTALLLGAACSLIVGLTVWLWHSAVGEALSIGGSVLLVVLASSIFGLSLPALLHALKLDPKIAAGPVTLAMADISTILIYFGIAAMML